MMGLGIGNVVVQTLLVGPFVKRFGERGTLHAGLMAGALAFAVYASATTALQFYLGIPLFCLMGLVQPGYQGIMSRRVGPDEQGRLQGANSGIMAIAGIVGPVIFTSVFAWAIRDPSVGPGPGAPFYLSVALLTMALVVALALPRGSDDDAR
jgi:DHA1 family tetracycline resistance protein-like MFS transporter